MIVSILTLLNTLLLIGGLVWIVRTWSNHLRVFNESDKERVEVLIASNERLLDLVTKGVAGMDRIELTVDDAKEAAGKVAHDLASAHIRADAVKALHPDAAPGTAADEASYSKNPTKPPGKE